MCLCICVHLAEWAARGEPEGPTPEQIQEEDRAAQVRVSVCVCICVHLAERAARGEPEGPTPEQIQEQQRAAEVRL